LQNRDKTIEKLSEKINQQNQIIESLNISKKESEFIITQNNNNINLKERELISCTQQLSQLKQDIETYVSKERDYKLNHNNFQN